VGQPDSDPERDPEPARSHNHPGPERALLRAWAPLEAGMFTLGGRGSRLIDVSSLDRCHLPGDGGQIWGKSSPWRDLN